MLKTSFNSRKGYFLPRKDQAVGKQKQYRLSTNGFDQIKWHLDDEKVLSDDESNDGPMYDDEDIKNISYTLNLKINEDFVTRLPTKSNSADEEAATSNSKSIKKNRQSKKTPKSSNSNSNSKKNKNKCKETDPEDDFISGNDSSKIKTLNNLYSKINKKFPNDSDKLFQFFDISLYKEDIYNLKDDEWLSDNNISFIYEFIERYKLTSFLSKLSKHSHNTTNKNSIILLKPSITYLLQHTPDPETLIGVIPSLEEAKIIFLPVNDNDDFEDAGGGSHWSLIVVSMLDRKALIYDTMMDSNHSESCDIINKLSRYLDGVNSKGSDFEIVQMSTPQQINGSDCGILVCQITVFLVSKLLSLDDNAQVNLSVDNAYFSSIDGRIFVLGFIVHLMHLKGIID